MQTLGYMHALINCLMSSVDPSRVIVKEGHRADCYYFVLSGNGEPFLLMSFIWGGEKIIALFSLSKCDTTQC